MFRQESIRELETEYETRSEYMNEADEFDDIRLEKKYETMDGGYELFGTPYEEWIEEGNRAT